MQETDRKYLDAEVVEALVSEDSKAALLQLVGDSDHIEEPPCKAMEKDNHEKKGRIRKK